MMRNVDDWKHDQAARIARSLAYIGRARGRARGGWIVELGRLGAVVVGIVAGLVILFSL